MFRSITNLGLILGIILAQFGCCCGLGTATASPKSEQHSPTTSNKNLKRSCCEKEEAPSPVEHEKFPGSCPCKAKKQFERTTTPEKFDSSKVRLLSIHLFEPEVRGLLVTSTPDSPISAKLPPGLQYGRHLLDLLQTFRC